MSTTNITPVNPVVAAGQLTFNMNVTVEAIENFDLVFLFNPDEVDSLTITGPIGWNITLNPQPGQVNVSGFNLNGTVDPDQVLLTVVANLKTTEITETKIDFTGSDTSTAAFPQTEMTLSDGAVAINSLPTGNVTISGTAALGQTLTASHTLSDVEGMGSVSYQWLADGVNIDGATTNTIVMGEAQLGKAITVKASYIDGRGTAESKTSVNNEPTGTVRITGTATQGQTLTATNTLVDVDGMGTVSYQWMAGGVNIEGATASTLVLGQDQVGKVITVKAIYTDGLGEQESKTSSSTRVVANVNDLPTGDLNISGTAEQGQTLTAISTLFDLDGLGTLSYQWMADNVNITDATNSTLMLGQAHVGKTITVKASYTDGSNQAESKTSTATAAVVNVNDEPTGTVTITGTATQNQTLTAANTLDDLDGMGTVTYQWLANGADISGATSSTLVLGQDQVGKTITVKASYTDGFNQAESKTSTATTAVANVNDLPTGDVTISGTATQGQELTAVSTLVDLDGMGTLTYQWMADGADISGATSDKLVLGQAQVGKVITVKASYTDGFNQAESKTSTATAAVVNVNDEPTGTVTITGTATQNQTLTAANTLDDLDGMGTVTYQWLANGADITDATNSTLVLGQDQVGKTITVKASYTDGFNQAESKTSTATTAVANVNDDPTGTVTITGTATQNQTLTAANTLADLDGMGTVTYQWLANGADISGATSSTLVLGQDQVGKTITVKASYTDGFNQAESKTSTATTAVANVNDEPTGTVTITGTATQNQTLTAANTLADLDGMGTVSYQWLADNVNITDATNSTLVLGQAQVGKAITVKASYTDVFNQAESKTSTATTAVANINDDPTGTVTITGIATQNQTLTAANTLADLDGMGTVTYQWMADNVNITGATNSTLVLGQAQVGKAITVKASYTDGFNKAESVTSTATAAVVNVNDEPTGTVTITGTTSKGATLTAANTLADLDGMGTVSYQWMADNVNITGATASTYTLSAAEVGKTITVKVSYTDGFNTVESKTSAPTAVVIPNSLPTGNVTITGTAAQNETLTASNTLVDLDGMGTVSYQWMADNVDIIDATASTLVLTQAQVGKAITLKASYTDGFGADESMTSTATAAVANVNDSPTGTVTITGTATQNQTLTAANTLADLDGMDLVSYQWMANGADISGATSSTLVLGQDQVGKTITVKASYTDKLGTAESMTSTATAAVANVNDSPTGTVTITGTATQNQTLTAANTLADLDGMDLVSYQWMANGADISGATSSTLVLGQDQVGKTITVKASYTDGFNKAESVTSTATTAVANVNDVPTGSVTITGITSKGATLTAANNLADVDGLGAVTYQWLANNVNITGATASTYTLTTAEVGKTITVKANYTDGQNTAESVTSAATAAVIPNSLPTGNVTVTGTAAQNQTLTVTNTLADADGMGTVTYQWMADNVNISGATSDKLVLTQAQVGKIITVKASYTDALSTPESKTSSATAAVANVNDAPTGAVTITGTATQKQTLTAVNTLADVDGMGTVSYQWMENGTNISGATNATLVLGQAQVGKTITVKASYTDGFNKAESKTSTATTAVVNVNDVPTGKPLITGTATQNQVLSVAASGIQDLDGMGPVALQWMANGINIAGATGNTFTLTQAQIGKTITVKASYTDGFGKAESVTSDPTVAVVNVNDAPTGTVSITGAGIVGLPLKATNSLADIDGMGTVSYQWKVGGNDISGATGETYTPKAGDAGKVITVLAKYTDGGGTQESKVSAGASISSEDDVNPLNATGKTNKAGDGNGDGILDSAQLDVASLAVTKIGTTNKVFVTLVANSNNGTIDTTSGAAEITSIQQKVSPGNLPSKMTMPVGMLDFAVKVSAVGATETFSLYVDANLGVNGYWKQDKSGTWVNLATEPYGGKTVIEGNKVRFDFKITDGGTFDSDGKADGVITDPGAVASMPLTLVGYAPDVVLTPGGGFFS